MLNERERFCLEQAYNQAVLAYEKQEVPVGAIVVHEQTIVAAAHNLRETTFNPLAHAELLALTQTAQSLQRWRLTGCTLFVTLEPCPMCAGALVNARIDRVIFAARDPKAGACGSLMNIASDPRLNHRVEVIEYLEDEKFGELLSKFFREKRCN